jgi:hypothetical protein
LPRAATRRRPSSSNTAENGSPFDHHLLPAAEADGNAPACESLGQPSPCQTFGIPPTFQVALPQWKLGEHYDALAEKYVDGYVWFGRPWLYAQSGPLDCELVEQMARSTPYPYPDGAPSGQESSSSLLRFNVGSVISANIATGLPPDPYCPASALG